MAPPVDRRCWRKVVPFRSRANEEVGEPCLVPKTGPEVHACGLVTLGVADRGRQLSDVCGSVEGQEQHPVIVAEHEVLIRDDMRSEPCGGERVTPWGSSRCGPAGRVPLLNTGRRMLRSSRESRCSPQITIPASPACWASRVMRSPTHASSSRPELSTTRTSPGSERSKASRNTSTLPAWRAGRARPTRCVSSQSGRTVAGRLPDGDVQAQDRVGNVGSRQVKVGALQAKRFHGRHSSHTLGPVCTARTFHKRPKGHGILIRIPAPALLWRLAGVTAARQRCTHDPGWRIRTDLR